MPIDADVMVSSKSFIESDEFMFDCNSLMLYFFLLLSAKTPKSIKTLPEVL